MTDYTERFRTASIQKLQQGYGALRDRLVTIVEETVGLQPVYISDEDLLTLLEKDHHDWRMRASLAREERDAALATVAKLTAELEVAKRERDEAQESLGSEIACPDCHDGGACLPGGCGVDGCTRCGETCRTCGGKVTLTMDELRLILATLRRQSARAGLDPKVCGELIATVRRPLLVGYETLLKQNAAEAIDKLAAMLGVEVAGG